MEGGGDRPMPCFTASARICFASLGLFNAEPIILPVNSPATLAGIPANPPPNIPNTAALSGKRQVKHTKEMGRHVWAVPQYGTPWTEEQRKNFLLNYWIPCIERLSIRYRRPYNMRHTYATMMLMAGMTPAFCARQ